MKFIPPLFFALFYLLFSASGKVDFNREVRPLLASKCYACHGQDEEGRKAKLRLDPVNLAWTHPQFWFLFK